ncbi:ABC transporter ATP-binding protein [Neorhizobium galegae]|uniref:Dipeptide ABC transporter, ATP-binding protein n=1 Tax=Neorhizobium galegae bv. orientalis str. HAMBI 540 TaxID=1028800 RepID=A0A068T1M9_NEOGA|nr:ABC transporter ATP-binding protein [Neorhizobium galegae]MCQ1853375.1 ABC transporter ATP-binding protein [Neorhizobium galegae]CDN51989.1 Dipeptide ABC transporter, ATP-binding protein [Neorhizobium galegae bv. orientalis str. HAMBI 540]
MSIPNPTRETTPLLRVRNLSVRFGQCSDATRALRNVSFDLSQEKLGIVGESGSGKSTLGRAILKLLPSVADVSADEMRFETTDLGRASEKQMLAIRGSRISMIMQDPKYALDPTMRIGDQIGEAVALHLKLGGRGRRNKVLELLEAVEIRGPERVYDLYPHQVSGGMGQRIMIAATLAANPRIIIADEPTSALDVTVRRKLLELLDRLVTMQQIGLIFITHDLNLAQDFCDRLLIMYAGQVVESLPATALRQARHPYTQGLLASLPRLDLELRRLPVMARDASWAKDIIVEHSIL